MSRQIETFSLNKKFNFLQPICSACPNIECLATEGSFDITPNISICVRLDKTGFYNETFISIKYFHSQMETIFFCAQCKRKLLVLSPRSWKHG